VSDTFNIHEAKTHLSRLVEQAAKGREFVIAKAGKPMVRVIPIIPVAAQRTLGFLAGKGDISTDLKKGFETDIEAMFGSAR
jgi:prevent-host-death family protein